MFSTRAKKTHETASDDRRKSWYDNSRWGSGGGGRGNKYFEEDTKEKKMNDNAALAMMLGTTNKTIAICQHAMKLRALGANEQARLPGWYLMSMCGDQRRWGCSGWWNFERDRWD